MMEVSDFPDVRSRVDRLSPRQIECLRLVYDRRTSKEIAATLGLSAATVDSYITDAVSLLGARNRRHAAELLHAADPPGKLGSRSSRGEITVEALQPAPKRPLGWTDWLLFRQSGAPGNDFHPAYRILFIPIGAVIFIIAFGMLASGARVVSDVLATWFR